MEWDTLVNPERDAGVTFVHGITDEMLKNAPTFSEIVGDLATIFNGRYWTGHYASFMDGDKMKREFKRTGNKFSRGDCIDTRNIYSGPLHKACYGYGIKLKDAHSALGDARATTDLFLKGSDSLTRTDRPCTAISSANPSGKTYTRQEALIAIGK